MSRTARHTALSLVLALPVLAGVVPSTASATARCPRSPERTLVTWTTAGGQAGESGVRITSRRAPLTRNYTPDVALLSGLAVGGGVGPGRYPKDLTVVVRRDPHGRGTAAVCDGRRRIATLPAVGRGEIVASATVNGRRVAWRTRRPTGRGQMAAAVVRDGRAVRIRTTQLSASTGGDVSGAIHLLPRGTVAWTMGAPRTQRGWVWPVGRTPVRIPRWEAPTDGEPAASVRILDARHVLVDGVLRAYRTPAPGSCPDVVGSTTTDLGGWRVAPISDGSLDDGQEQSDSSTTLVCDPALGTYVAVVPSASSEGSTVGEPASGWSVTLHRAGPWLLSTRTPFGDYAENRRSISGRNVRTGERFEADGSVEIAGRPHPAEGTRQGIDTSGPRWVTGATAGPGVLAWCARPTSGSAVATVWLSDARGTRTIAETPLTATPADAETRTCGLGLTGSTLRWGPADAPHEVTMEPGTDTALG